MAHMLDAARDRHVVRAKGNARGRRRHRRHGAGAHPVDGVSRHRGWQAREERGGASDGEALVSALCGRGDGDIVDTVWWQLRIAPQQLANDGDHHVVGTRLGIEPGRPALPNGVRTPSTKTTSRRARATRSSSRWGYAAHATHR